MADTPKNRADLLTSFTPKGATMIAPADFRNFVVSSIPPVVTAGVIDYWDALSKSIKNVDRLSFGYDTAYIESPDANQLLIHATVGIELSSAASVFIEALCLAARYVTDTTAALATDVTIVCNKPTAMTVNLPAAEGTKHVLHIKNIGAGVVTVDANASETIDGETTQTVNQWDCLVIQDVEISGTPTYGWVII